MAFRYTQVVSILCITSYFDVFNNFCELCYFLSVAASTSTGLFRIWHG